jgi:hypothetical protein
LIVLLTAEELAGGVSLTRLALLDPATRSIAAFAFSSCAVAFDQNACRPGVIESVSQ